MFLLYNTQVDKRIQFFYVVGMYVYKRWRRYQ